MPRRRHRGATARPNGDDLGNDLRTIHYIRNDKNLDFAQIGVRIVAVILECCLDVKTNGGPAISTSRIAIL
jgi:hypothetical protein